MPTSARSSGPSWRCSASSCSPNRGAASPTPSASRSPGSRPSAGPPTSCSTQRIGDRFSGIGGLSLTIPVAAATAAVVGVPQAAGHLTPGILAAALGLAVLLPVLPFALEMMALRRLTPSAFGTLMALEPAIGTLLGLLVLHQQPSPSQVAGIALVVLAGAAAQRGGRRGPHEPAAGGTFVAPGATPQLPT